MTALRVRVTHVPTVRMGSGHSFVSVLRMRICACTVGEMDPVTSGAGVSRRLVRSMFLLMERCLILFAASCYAMWLLLLVWTDGPLLCTYLLHFFFQSNSCRWPTYWPRLSTGYHFVSTAHLPFLDTRLFSEPFLITGCFTIHMPFIAMCLLCLQAI